MTDTSAADGPGSGPDFFANRAEFSSGLIGHRLTLTTADSSTEYVFDSATQLLWCESGSADFSTESYAAFAVGEGLYLVAFALAGDITRSMELVIDVRDGRALVLDQRTAPKKPGATSVVQKIGMPRVSRDGAAAASDDFEPIAQTEELLGARVLWEYGAQTIYEHIYLNSEWYIWHVLAGDEYPMADADPCSIFKIRDSVYALAINEIELTMGVLMVFDFSIMRSYCAAFGIDHGRTDPETFMFGAYGKLLSRTEYPSPLTAR